ncbi:MAG: peptidoglycan-binding protein [Vicinamibacterales bacterium]
MNELQSRTAKAIVNIFETGRVAGDYGAVTVLKGDSGHLTYGRSQTTLGSGNLFLLIRAYCARADALFASELTPFLASLAARDTALDRNPALREALRDAGDDPAMRAEQDRFFDDHYFKPALSTAAARGITEPLGQTVVYDSIVHGGFGKVAARVGAAVSSAGVDQREWVRRYVTARRAWLKGLAAPLPATVYRMDAFEALIGNGAWELPLDLKVRGVTISTDNLDPAPVLRATAADADDPPPPRILVLTSPFMRGEDVRLVQEALRANGSSIEPDGIFGNFTETLVRQFQANRQLRADGVVGPATRAALGL